MLTGGVKFLLQQALSRVNTGSMMTLRFTSLIWWWARS